MLIMQKENLNYNEFIDVLQHSVSLPFINEYQMIFKIFLHHSLSHSNDAKFVNNINNHIFIPPTILFIFIVSREKEREGESPVSQQPLFFI